MIVAGSELRIPFATRQAAFVARFHPAGKPFCGELAGDLGAFQVNLRHGLAWLRRAGDLVGLGKNPVEEQASAEGRSFFQQQVAANFRRVEA